MEPQEIGFKTVRSRKGRLGPQTPSNDQQAESTQQTSETTPTAGHSAIADTADVVGRYKNLSVDGGGNPNTKCSGDPQTGNDRGGDPQTSDDRGGDQQTSDDRGGNLQLSDDFGADEIFSDDRSGNLNFIDFQEMSFNEATDSQAAIMRDLDLLFGEDGATAQVPNVSSTNTSFDSWNVSSLLQLNDTTDNQLVW